MNYLQPNISNETALDIIRSKIQNETPFSLIRFGDGETHILKRKPPSEMIDKRYCEAFGYKYPEESSDFWNDAYGRVSAAIRDADMIGIMDFTTDIGQIMSKGNSWKFSEELFTRITEKAPYEVYICDHMICRSEEMGALSSMKKLCDGKDIHIISPNVRELKNNEIEKILECNVTYTNNPFSINFNNRESVIKSFDKIKAPVVLFGSSLNKDYGTILAREHGKVALDMGATLDAWSNKITRPWFNNSQKYLVHRP